MAFVAATAMEQGLRAGLKVTLAPFLVETPVMLVTVVVLSQLPDGFLRWAGRCEPETSATWSGPSSGWNSW